MFVFQNYISRKHEGDKVVVFDRADKLVFVFNWHPSNSYTDYKIGVNVAGKYPFSIHKSIHILTGPYRQREQEG